MSEYQKAFDASFAEGRKLQVAGEWAASSGHLTTLLVENQTQHVRLLCERGLTFRMQGQFDLADGDFRQALSISQRTRNVDGVLDSYSGLIDSARKSKRIPLARDYQEDAQTFLDTLPDEPRLSIANVLINFGLLFHDTKEEAQALKNYGAAEVVCRQLIMQDPDNIDFQNRLARVFTVRPESYKALEMFTEAGADLEEAFTLNSKLGDVRGMTNSAYSTAELYEMRGNIDQARKWYKKTLEAAHKVEDGKIVIVDATLDKMADDALLRLASK